MAKKMISRLSVLAVLIVFLAACSKTVEYTNIIPADATVVTSINLKSLASKAGLNDKENEAAKQKVLEALKSGMNAATFQQLEKVMNNPSESGIDVEAPVYVFTSPSFPYSTAVAKIKSEDDLHASLEIMVKEQICQPINEAAGYSFTTMNGGLVAFNNSTVMLISVKGTSQIEKAKEGITNLLKQTADNSIAKSGAFQKMEKQKSDINFFASMAAIPAPYQEQICQPINEAAGYSFTTMNGGLVAFNNSTVMLISVKGTSQIEKAKEGITNLLKQTADNSIAKSGAFQKMEKQKSDINFFASMAAIPAPYQEQVSMGLPAEVKAEDITIIAGLNFEKGRIALKTENYTENEAVKALMKKQLEAFGKANNTFVKYFPASTLMFVNLGIKGEGLYNLLSENKEFRNTVSISKADEVKELFSSFNGDISAGLINVTMNSAPTFIVYADVKNGNALEALYKNKQALGLKKGEDILELGKNEYVYKSKGMNVFFGIKDKQMYATNDELLYKNIEKAADKSIKDAPYASEMKGKTVFMAINAEAILELPVVKMLIGFGGEKFRTGSEMLSKVSYLSVSSEGETSEIDLCLKDKDVNALKLIVDFGKQFTGM